MKTNLEVLKLRQEDKDVVGANLILNNLGVIFYRIGDPEKALSYYNLSLLGRDSTADRYDTDRLLVNMGLCFNELGQYNKADEFFRRAIAECAPNCRKEIMVEVEVGLGITNLNIRQLDKALAHFKRSLKIADEINHTGYRLISLTQLGFIYLEKGKLLEAATILRRYKNVALAENFSLELSDLFKQLADVSIRLKDYHLGCYYQQRYLDLTKQIYQERIGLGKARVEIEHAERESINMIEHQEKMIRAKDELIDANQMIKIVLIVLIVLLLILGSILVLRYWKVQRRKQLLNLMVDRRTLHLLRSHDELVRAGKIHELFNERMRQEMRSYASSLFGLCEVGLKDQNFSPVYSQTRKVEEQVHLLMAVIGTAGTGSKVSCGNNGHGLKQQGLSDS